MKEIVRCRWSNTASDGYNKRIKRGMRSERDKEVHQRMGRLRCQNFANTFLLSRC
jgi:hypothetical protein